MFQSNHRTLYSALILSLLLNQGCFYMVEEGKGGVAERFPIPQEHWHLSQRLHECEAAITEQSLYGKAQLHPALYQQTQKLLTESRRLFKAEYYQQAELTLEPVETVLKLMHQNMHIKAVKHLCQSNAIQEVCL